MLWKVVRMPEGGAGWLSNGATRVWSRSLSSSVSPKLVVPLASCAAKKNVAEVLIGESVVAKIHTKLTCGSVKTGILPSSTTCELTGPVNAEIGEGGPTCVRSMPSESVYVDTPQ